MGCATTPGLRVAARLPPCLGIRRPGGGAHPARHRRAGAAGDVAPRRDAADHRLLRLRGGIGPLRLPGLQPADVGRRRLDHRPALRRRGVRPGADGLAALRRAGGDPGRDGGAHGHAGGPVATRVDRRVSLHAHRDRLPVRRGGHHHHPPAAGLPRPATDWWLQPHPLRQRGHPPRRGERLDRGHRHRRAGGAARRARGSTAASPER